MAFQKGEVARIGGFLRESGCLSLPCVDPTGSSGVETPALSRQLLAEQLASDVNAHLLAARRCDFD